MVTVTEAELEAKIKEIEADLADMEETMQRLTDLMNDHA